MAGELPCVQNERGLCQRGCGWTETLGADKMLPLAADCSKRPGAAVSSRGQERRAQVACVGGCDGGRNNPQAERVRIPDEHGTSQEQAALQRDGGG